MNWEERLFWVGLRPHLEIERLSPFFLSLSKRVEKGKVKFQRTLNSELYFIIKGGYYDHTPTLPRLSTI
jgi:hypothetical protein